MEFKSQELFHLGGPDACLQVDLVLDSLAGISSIPVLLLYPGTCLAALPGGQSTRVHYYVLSALVVVAQLMGRSTYERLFVWIALLGAGRCAVHREPRRGNTAITFW